MAKGRFQQALEKKITERLNTTSRDLVGGAPKDYAEYRQYVGYIMALHDCLLFCEEAEREME